MKTTTLLFSFFYLCLSTSLHAQSNCSGIPTAGTVSPANATRCSGSSLTLTLTGYTTGVTGITFQWQSSPDSITFTTISGATTTSYNTPPLTVTTYYKCMVSCSGGGAASSNIVKITISGLTTLVLQPNAANGIDALVSNLPINLNANYGTWPWFDCQAWTWSGTAGVERSFIQFNLSSIPTNTTVQQALLYLYNDPNATVGNPQGTHSSLSGSDAGWLQKVTAPWSESTIAWNNQPATTTTNQVTVPQSTSPHQDYVLDITTLAQDMITNPSTNYGLMMRLQTESYYRDLVFASSDNADSTKRPKLTVTYGIAFAAIISAGGPTTFCAGGNVVLNASPTGSPYTYQWKFNGSGISGATSNSYTVTSGGSYTCVIADSCNSLTSNSISVTVNALPSAIITAGGSTAICSGSSVTLSANTGSGLSYQWMVNSGTISGATAITYSASSAGSYICVVTNSCGSSTSNIISVTISSGPPGAVITANGPTTFCAGGSVVLNANTGSGLSYQWKLNGSNISGATSSSYTATAAGSYTCLVSNNCGSATSNAITVTITGLTTITLQPNAANGIDALVSNLPINLNANYGTWPWFDCQAWTWSGTAGVERSFIQFNLSSIPTNTTVQQALLYLYNDPNATVGNPQGTHSSLSGSDAGWLQKVTAPWSESTIAWNNQPATTTTNQVTVPQSTSPHQDYVLDITTLAQDMITNPSTNYGLMMRLQTESYYRDLVFASSDNADSTKWPKLTISYSTGSGGSASISAGGPTTFCQGGSVTLSALPAGASYQWQVNSSNISGATTSSYSATSTGNYTCQVTSSGCGTSTSNTITVTVNPNITVSVSISASATTICSGTAVSFAATTVNGGSAPSFQWKVNGINAGTNDSLFTTSSLANGDVVTCVLTSSISTCSSSNPATSNNITMTVIPPQAVSVSIAASATTICSGTSVSFTATPVNGGSSPSYQWQVNGINVGPNNAVYTTTSLLNNDVVTCVLTSTAPCRTSNTSTSAPITMSVTGSLPFSVSIVASSTSVCAGTAVTFTATAVNGGPNLIYQWKVNGNNTGPNSNIFSGTFSNGNVITCMVVSGSNCVTGNPATSNNITITVNPYPVATASSNSPVCAGNPLNLSATGGASYNWTGPNNFSSTDQYPSIAEVLSVNGGTYTVTVTNAYGCTTTATTLVSICGIGNHVTLSLQNCSQPAPNTLQFDLDVLSDGVATSDLRASNFLFGVNFNTAILQSGATISASYLSGTADFLPPMTGFIFPASSSPDHIRISGLSTGGNTGNTMVVGHLYRVGRFQFTSSANWVANSNPTLNLQAVVVSGKANCTAVVWIGNATGTTNLATNGTGNNQRSVNAACSSILNTCNLSAAITSTSVSCFGGSNGSVSVNVSGGFSPFTYLWNTGTTTSSVGGLAAGNYSVTITDAINCTASAAATISQPSQLICSSAVITPIQCNSGAATVVLSGSGGSTPYSGTGSFSCFAGAYNFIITDANGCTASTSIVITEPSAISVSSSSTNVSCHGGSNGSASVLVIGGTPTYSYLWSAGNQTTSSIFNLTAGNYAVYITDANGCSTLVSFTISQPSPVVATINSNSPVCAGNSILLTASAGSSYLWSGPDNFSSTASQPNISSSTTINSGIYSVTVTDASGCIGSASTTISVNICPPTLTLKLFIEGYYLGTGMMQPVLKNEAVSTSTTVTDSINIELRDEHFPDTVSEVSSGILMTNGSATVALSNAVPGHSFWIVVKHRSAVQTWSAAPVAFSTTTVYDFTTQRAKAYRNNQTDLYNEGIWSFYNGDINQDENVDLLDFQYFDFGINTGSFGYVNTDLNGDGNTDLLDFPLYNLNLLDGVYSKHP